MKSASKIRNRKPRYGREEIIRLISKYQGSGLRQREFAEAQGVGYSTFTQWLGKHRKGLLGSVDGSWLEVDHQAKAIVAEYAVEIDGNRTLRFRSGFDPKEIQQLIELLRKA